MGRGPLADSITKDSTDLEVDTSVDCDGPRSRIRCRMSGDAAETGGVDVGVRVVPYRPVQYIHRVGTDGERRSLGKPGPFLKRHVEAEAGWPFKAGQRQSEVSGRTRLRVLKNDI